MDTLGERELWSFYDGSPVAKRVTTITTVRKGRGHLVRSFLDLATKVAELQFRNREHVLMFRGQGSDHVNSQRNTALKPSLFRPKPKSSAPPDSIELTRRFLRLRHAENVLVSRYAAAKFLGVERLKRHRILRWAILQHYEVCRTPLLDVTHSLRIAASFASLAATKEAFIFVVAVPNLSGAVTASAEAGLQIVRLSSVCPPAAVRPHIPEGYLLGEYPDIPDYGQKSHYGHYEIDFGRRLIAKFRFDPAEFWRESNSFPCVADDALYPPPVKDPLCDLAQKIKTGLGPE